jgi:hypothetical protein
MKSGAKRSGARVAGELAGVDTDVQTSCHHVRIGIYLRGQIAFCASQLIETDALARHVIRR